MEHLCYKQALGEDMKALNAFLPQTPFVCELSSYLQCNGTHPEAGRIWCGTDEGGSLREVLFNTGSYCYYLKAGDCRIYKNAEETALFANPSAKDRLFLMVYKKNPPTEKAGERNPIISLTHEELKSFYAMLNHSDCLPENSEETYIQRVRLQNRGLAQTVGIYQNNTLIAGGAIGAKNQSYALIGDIFTQGSYRGQGCASRILTHLIHLAKDQQLTPFVICEARMILFYKKRGFELYDDKLYTMSQKMRSKPFYAKGLLSHRR